MEKLNIVFMGTPDFAVGSLKALVEDGQQIVGVITAPDRASGRGQKIQSSPVKQYAIKKGITPILQPANLKDPEFIEELKKLKADIQVVVAFRMLPEIVWTMPLKGTVNLHASLLPDYRGAAPINWTIINGEKETGVTTFFIDKEIDTGKILFSEKFPIGPDTNAGELHDGLMGTGAKLLVKTVHAIEENNYRPVAQSELLKGKIHQAPKIFKEDCKINWDQPAQKIHDLIRGLSPYPAAWTEFRINNETVQCKIYKNSIEWKIPDESPGVIVTDRKKYLKIAAKDGYVNILNLQPASKKPMNTDDFLRGIQNLDPISLIVNM